jgi:L-fucose isomerase-like protein
VPILIQAYPDELTKMAPEVRRDSFCGKFSVMDVFFQNKIKFTALKPHTVSPSSPTFAANVDHFDRVCRVVKGLKDMVVGSIGARTSAFKTVRIDELALQQNGITMETFDLSYVFKLMEGVSERDVKTKLDYLKSLSDWSCVPNPAQDNLGRLGVVLDNLVRENKLDALALRCWVEMQQQLGISPCCLLGEMNERGVAAACEVDVGNAIAMHALKLACGKPAACLDWNNNYGDDENKCILFHCGPVPMSLMTGKGKIEDHAILANAVGKGCAFGCNVGRITPTPFTFASLTTQNGRLNVYVGEGDFTSDPVPADFFGCAGVAKIDQLQDVLLHVGRLGHRHHVSVSAGRVANSVAEAFGYYLGYDVTVPQVKP